MNYVSYAVLIVTCFKVCHSEDLETRRISGNAKPVKRHVMYMAQLLVVLPLEFYEYYDGHFCGGTIIHWEWILTAGHCVDVVWPKDDKIGLDPFEVEPKLLTVRVGSIYAGYGQEIEIKKIRLHENYVYYPKTYNDIGLVKTAAMKFTSQYSKAPIGVVELSEKPFDVEDGSITVRIYGWQSKIFHAEKLEDQILDFVYLNIYNWTVCSHYAGYDLSREQFCTAVKANRTAPCHGDSGGPIILNGKQVGLVSRGATDNLCGIHPDIHTRVDSHIDWIKNNLKLNLTHWREVTNNGMDYSTCGDACNHLTKLNDLKVGSYLRGEDIDYVRLDDLSFNISHLSIKVGEKYVGAGKYVRPLEIHVHEKHDIRPFTQYDIALIKTVPMKFTPEDSPTPIGPVTLNTIEFDRHVSDSVVRIFGWGAKYENKDPTKKALEYVDVRIYPWGDCVYEALKPVHKYELCTGPTKQSGPCGGDSGGPVMYNGVQVALVSRGIDYSGCGVVPEVHTMVEPFQDWIFGKVGLNLTTWRNQTNNGMDFFQHYLKEEDLELPAV